MRSEERRALVLLGITAILSAFLATIYALIWTGAKKQEDFFFNVPCSTVPHLTVYDVPILQALIGAWVAYAVFAFFYFSDDWFQGRRGIRFRDACHVFAAISMGFYFIFAVSFIPAVYVLLVWIPSQLGSLYVEAVLLGLLYVEIRFVEMATYSPGLYRAFFTRFWQLTYGPIFTAFRRQLKRQTTILWNKHSGKLPPKPRDGLVSLRRSIQRIRQNRRVRGRRNLFTVFLGLFTILLVVAYLLYGTYCGFPLHF
jgi:hypothetical protein